MSTVCIYSDEDIGVCFVVPGPGSCYKESNIMETKIRYSTVLGRCISFLRSPCPGDDNRNVFNDEDSCMKACEHVGKV
ncbi:Hypothetical predicted protein [Mytilus galloprovincialis]|nr:Hypothetical predicted protein [Mytilus galloprovincialis]